MTDNFEKINTTLVDETLINNVVIYPNPTKGKVLIDLVKSLNDIKVSIQTLNGKIIHQSAFNNSQILELYITEPAGVYIVTITSENKKSTIRLIKN